MRTLTTLVLLGLAACNTSPPTAARLANLAWARAPDRSIALLHEGQPLWRFHHDRSQPHAFFHPLALPGTQSLTLDQPADHVWHHGLWFSWKFIDGVNYWEHAAGSDRPAGRTDFAEPAIEVHDDGSATIRMHVDYAPGDDTDAVLTEERSLVITPPAADGSYAIDWTGRFTALGERVLLDRTPLPGEPGGKVFGGYAGLSLRLANFAERSAITTDGPAKFNDQDRLRTRSNGFDYSGELAGEALGIAVLAHPDNPNAPSPWYAIRSPQMSFFTPAVICYGSLELVRGQHITLRYRIVVHRGRWTADRLAAEAGRFAVANTTPDREAVSPPTRLARNDDSGEVTASFDGHVAFSYRYAPAFALPHIYPLAAPSGRSLLVQKTEPYPHHRALWIADRVQIADGPDVDFYHEWKNLRDPERPELGHHSFIRHDLIRDQSANDDIVSFTAESTWIVREDTPVLADTRHFTAHRLGHGEYLLDLAWELRAAYGDVTFRSDAVHYAWPYLRMAREFSGDAGGVLVDDTGRRGQKATDGTVAHWIDYSNTIDGLTEGVAVFVQPDGEPHAWLTREYGTFGPRRAAAFSGTGFTLAKGESIGGRVGILVHRGDAVIGKVAERYREYCSKE